MSWGVEEGLDVAALRAELDRVLTPRRDDVPLVVLGGGNDDLEPGRAYLAALAPGGWIAATWPAEYGGRGLSPAGAAVVSRELGRYAAPDLYPYLVGLARRRRRRFSRWPHPSSARVAPAHPHR